MGIRLRRVRSFIPVTQFTGITYGVRATTGAGADAVSENGTEFRTANAATRVLRDATTATAQNIMRYGARDNTNSPANVPGSYLVELNSLGTYGLMVLTAADGIRHFQNVNNLVDTRQPIGFRAVWTSGAAAVSARSITWRVQYSALANNAVMAAPATALDTTIAADTPVGVGWEYQRSPRGFINASSTTAGAPVQGTVALNLRVDASALAGWAGAGSADNPFLLGLEMDFVPRLQPNVGVADMGYVTNPLSDF